MTYHYSQCDVQKALREIGIIEGDTLFSHSNIGYLGKPKGKVTAENAINTLLHGIFSVIGDRGTLVVPTFTYSFSQGKAFDPTHSVSNCGIFSEGIRNNELAVRSEDPSISVAAVGANALELTQNLPENAYGENSFFDRFYMGNGTICNINFDAGSTLIHYIERILSVPYRYDKSFTGVFTKNGVSEEKQSTIYVRHLVKGTEAKFEAFSRVVEERGLYKTAALGRGFIGMIKAKDVMNVIQELLSERPWFLTEAEGMKEKPVIKY